MVREDEWRKKESKVTYNGRNVKNREVLKKQETEGQIIGGQKKRNKK